MAQAVDEIYSSIKTQQTQDLEGVTLFFVALSLFRRQPPTSSPRRSR